MKLPRFLIIVCFLSGFAGTLFSAEPADYSSQRRGNSRIVVPESASSPEIFAAEELNKYLKLLTSSNPGVNPYLSADSIIVGTYASICHDFPGIVIPPLQGDQYGVFRRGEKLCLAGGCDRSLLYAVYHFLKLKGCLWIAPDYPFYEGDGHHLPVRESQMLTHQRDILETPSFKYRKLYVEEGLTHNPENLRQLVDWMPKARLNVLVIPIDYQGHGRVKWDNWREELVPELEKRGILIEVGGHGYQNFLNAGMESGRLFERHPEWFGMDAKGVRSADPHLVFCTSNREALSYLQSGIASYLRSHPEIDIFDFWPPDSEKWCECSDCRAMGSASDRHAILVSQMAEFLKRELPSVTLECLAYSKYVAPPASNALPPNVLVDFCPINQSFEYQIFDSSSVNNAQYKDHLLKWLDLFDGDISIYSYYRKYAWRSLPVILPHYMQRDLQFYRDRGAKGISVYSEPGDWFTYGVNHFVLSELAWNPGVKVDSLVSLYGRQLFGGAASLAAEVFTELEDIVRFGCKIPFTLLKEPAQYDEYIRRLEAMRLKLEKERVGFGADEKAGRHLERLGLMLQYASLSASLMKSTALANSEEVTRLTDSIRKLMAENGQKGVFIPR